MQFRSRFLLTVAAIVLTVAVANPLHGKTTDSNAADPDDIYWYNDLSGIRGTNAQIRDFTIYNNMLVAAGDFTAAGSLYVDRIAAWDGSDWHPLGSGFDNRVRAVTVYDGQLIAGGDFDAAGDSTAAHLAVWNGTAWSELGGGMNNDVHCLLVHDGALLVGGSFTDAGQITAKRIAAWDGSSWTTFGSGLGSGVHAMTIYNGNIVVGGYFTAAGGNTANRIAMWDGSTWSTFGDGMNGTVHALAVYNGDLIAGGEFATAGGLTVDKIASWNGSNWDRLRSGMFLNVYALHVHENLLYAGGNFISAGGITAHGIAAWDGNIWSTLESGITLGDELVENNFAGTVRAMIGYDQRLFVGGDFTYAGYEYASHIASWDGADWDPVGTGFGPSYPGSIPHATVKAFEKYDDQLIAGGIFRFAGDSTVNAIAAYDGIEWTDLNGGVMYSSGDPHITRINELIVYDSMLVAGGLFDSAGTIAANNIAAWDGNSWRTLGSGVSGEVTAMTVWDGKLIVGGEFGDAGGVSVWNLAAWDGNGWSELDGWRGGEPLALEAFQGNLVLGGRYVDGVKVYDGSTVSTLGDSLGNVVWDLCVFRGDLIAAGSFSVGVTSNGIARFDGSQWQAMGQPLGVVYALEAKCDSLFAGMGNTHLHSYNFVSAWDGFGWLHMGSGMEHYVSNGAAYALEQYNGQIIAGGEFIAAGEKPAAAIAAWGVPSPNCCNGIRGDLNGDNEPGPDAVDLAYLVDFLYNGGTEPNCPAEGDINADCSEQPDAVDLAYLVDYIFSGGAAPAECP